MRSTSAALRTNYGVLLWQKGLNQEAIAAQREALRLKPGDPVALLNLGLALKAAGDPAGAMNRSGTWYSDISWFRGPC